MQLKKGMMVKIGNDLTKTYEAHGSAGIMEEMRGKIFKIEEIIGDRILIQSPESTFQFSFKDCDLIIYNEVKTPKPIASKDVIFDIDNLNI